MKTFAGEGGYFLLIVKGSKLLPQQQKSFREALFFSQISSLSSKGFLSRNTLEVQPSFRNSLLNTVLYCKPQLAIYFILPSALPGFRAQSPDFQLLSEE